MCIYVSLSPCRDSLATVSSALSAALRPSLQSVTAFGSALNGSKNQASKCDLSLATVQWSVQRAEMNSRGGREEAWGLAPAPVVGEKMGGCKRVGMERS